MSSKMATSEEEQRNNIYKKVINDKSGQKYKGNIKKGRKGCTFGVGTLKVSTVCNKVRN